MEIVDLKELALQKVKIEGDIIGKFGKFEIEQTYKNNTNNVLEVTYTFPIVETATVVGFEINVADRVLKGQCKESGKAKKEYQENIVKGNSAYMMEQNADNVFKISVGKIDKDEEVKIKIYYIDKFEIVDNKIQVLIPTLVAPKYKSEVTDKLIYGTVDYTIDFNIRVDKVVCTKNIECTTHRIELTKENNNTNINIVNYDLSKDFKLYIELKKELSSNAIISQTKENNEVLYLSFMPEIIDTYEDTEKDYIFIVDVSGSMSGKNIVETKRAVKECLKQLDDGDKFNIVPFSNDFEAMNIKSLEYNEENYKKAIKYIDSLEARGGTEILKPIKFSLYDTDTDKVVLLFTDGQVGNEDEIIQFVQKNIGKSRLFPFGIDTNVNSAFIKQLAKVGHGKPELIMPNEKIDDKIIRTFARIQTPLLENIKVDFGKNKVIDEIREEDCLFNYEFFNVFAKIENLVDDIKLKGEVLNKEISWTIKKDDINNTSVDLELLFAKLEIERIENYMRNTRDYEKQNIYKNMIVEISEKYNINSKYTSFITVYERENKLIDIPVYQDTRLSDLFMVEECRDVARYAKQSRTIGSRPDVCACMDMSADLDIPTFLRKNTGNKSNDIVSINKPSVKKEKTNKETLTEVIFDFYNELLKDKNKSLKTYLLYAIYYLTNYNFNEKLFNYTTFIKFLGKNKELLEKDEALLGLLAICYLELADHRFIDKDNTLDLLGYDFKKAISTGMKFSIELNVKDLTDEDIDEIVKNNEIVKNIDNVIWYFINNNRYSKFKNIINVIIK